MYQPKPAPQDPKQLPDYLASELQAIAQAGSDRADVVRWNVLHVAPAKPREGDVAFADGTDWNPGSGEGPYKYLSGAWSAFAGGGGSGANLAYTASATNGIVTSDTGTDATLPLATGTNAGLLAPADFTKLSNTSGTNTGNETAASIKTALGITTLSGSNTGDQTISITGDVTAAGSTGALSATVTKINGTALSGLATGILKNTTTTGVPSIAAAGTDYVAPGGALGTPSSGVATNLTGTASGLTAGNVTTNANLTGDVTSVGNAATVVKINGTSLSGLATGILKNTTGTGVPSIAVGGTDYLRPADAGPILANVILGSAGTSLASGTIPARQFLEVHIWLEGYAGSDTASLQFNATAGTGYRYRWLTCAAAATTFTAGLVAASTDRIKIAAANTTSPRRVVASISNDSSVTEKLVFFGEVTGTGSAGTQATIDMGNGAWISGAATQITSISLISTSNMLAGTQMTVFGWN